MKKCLPKTHHFSSGPRLLYFSGRIHQEEGKVSLASVALATYVAKQQAGYLLAGLNFQAAERLTAMTAEPIPFVKCFPASKTRYFAYFSLPLMLFPICFVFCLLISLAVINLNSKSSSKSHILGI